MSSLRIIRLEGDCEIPLEDSMDAETPHGEYSPLEPQPLSFFSRAAYFGKASRLRFRLFMAEHGLGNKDNGYDLSVICETLSDVYYRLGRAEKSSYYLNLAGKYLNRR